jgi:hypothetical protein
MNFGLLAESEQDAIIYAYAALLNSLNFPIQIVINSKTKDATTYLQLLENQLNKETAETKKGMIKRYQNFVGQLIRERNVLDKKFYVIIPAQPIEVGMLTAQSILPGQRAPEITHEQKAAVIEKGLGILEPRRDHLIAQFNRIGMYARQLVTQEIIEIFYNNYNPEAYEGQQITDSQNYTAAMVNAGTAKAPSLDEIRAQLQTKAQLAELSNKETSADSVAQTIKPASPAEPTQSAQPTEPIQPTQSVQSAQPTQPVQPTQSDQTTPFSAPTTTTPAPATSSQPASTQEPSLPPVAEL